MLAISAFTIFTHDGVLTGNIEHMPSCSLNRKNKISSAQKISETGDFRTDWEPFGNKSPCNFSYVSFKAAT